MKIFRLAVLGSPQVTWGDQVLRFSTRKELALLLYLALERGQHTRKSIADLLWPQSDELQARTALRVTLQRLRGTLDEPESADEQKLFPLSLTGDKLALNPLASVEVDAEEFAAAWTLARQSLLVPSPSAVEQGQAQARLEHALALVRGPFLEGFAVRGAAPFEAWMRVQREHWHLQMIEVCERLSLLQERAGAIKAALETAQRWLNLDPLNDSAVRQLMRLQLAMGNRSLALQTYETLVERLQAELAVQPDPETVLLARQMRQDAPPAHRSAALRETARSRATLFSTSLVGREAEMGFLMTRYQETQTGQFQAVLLEGEAGIGKSRLVRDFTRWAADHKAQVLSGRAFEVGGRLPYQPIVDALRPWLDQENAPDDLLSDVWLAELARLLPELRERYPDLPSPVNEESVTRAQLFESITRLLLAWAARAPLILWIDDVQWADVASLDLLLFVAEHLNQQRIPFLLILSLRDEEIEKDAALATWRHSMSRVGRVSQLTLGALSEPATVQLLRLVWTRESIPDEVAQAGHWFYRQARGIPFYLFELLRGLVEREEVRDEKKRDGTWMLDGRALLGRIQRGQIEVPATIRAVISARLTRLSSSARILLAAGAVLDQWSTFPALLEVAGLSEQEGLAALDEALHHRILLQERPRGRNRRGQMVYLFTHDLLREVVTQEAGEARLRVMHLRSFKLLKREEASAAELALHAVAAGKEQEAFHWNLMAGNEAMTVFAVHDAISFYERARSILLPEASDQIAYEEASREQVSQLFVQLGQAYELLQQVGAARQTYEMLEAYARQRQDECLLCIALNYLVRVLALDQSQLARVRMLLEEARQAAEQCGDETLLKETIWNEYQQGGAAWDQEALAALGEEKNRYMQEVQNWLVVARNLSGFAYDNPQMTSWERARASIEQAIVWYQQQGNQEMEAYAWSLLSGAQIQRDELQATIFSLRKASSLSRQCGSVYGQVIAEGALAYGLLLAGDYEEAWKLGHAAVAGARRVGFYILLEEHLFILGDILLTCGYEEQAEQAYLEGLRFSVRLGVRGDIELLAARLCMLYAQQENWRRALASAEQAQAAREDHILPIFVAPSYYETETWLRAGKRVEAEREIERLERRRGRVQRHCISLLRSQAILAQVDGKYDEARTSLEEAYRLAELIGLPGERWQILAALGDLYAQMDQQEQSQAAIVQAASLLEELADRIHDQELRTHYLNVRTVRRVLEQAQQLPKDL